MFIKTNDVVNMPVDKLQNMFDKLINVNNSKVFNNDEEREYREQILSFAEALKKCGNGHLVSPELKPLIKEIEKVGYDFTKLPKSLKDSFDSTYVDFKMMMNSSKEFKNTQISTYCKMYEFFHNKDNLFFIDRMQRDPFYKKNAYTAESITSIDTLELALQDDRSLELNFNIITKHALLGSVKTAIFLPNTFVAFVIIISVLLIAAIVALIVINLKYKSELTKILKTVTNEDVKRDGKENVHSVSSYAAAKSMVEKTSPLTKNTCFKPIEFALQALQKITSFGYGVFEKLTKKLNLAKNSKESYEYSQEFLLGGGLAIPIIVSIILIIIMLKPLVYWIYNLKMRCSVFFEEEATLLEINIEDLLELQNNAVSEEEKERIGKIIEKQRKAMINMSSLSNFFYKQTNDASLKTRDDIRDNDSIDYGSMVDDMDKPENGRTEITTAVDPNTPYSEPTTELPTSGSPVVLF